MGALEIIQIKVRATGPSSVAGCRMELERQWSGEPADMGFDTMSEVVMDAWTQMMFTGGWSLRWDGPELGVTIEVC